MRKQVQLQGPRPAPLVVSKNSKKIIKKSVPNYPSRGPVIVYLKSPDVIHVRPEEFMSLVQRLTGKPAAPSTVPSSSSSSLQNSDYGSDDIIENGSHSPGQSAKFSNAELAAQQKFDSPLAAYPAGFCLNIYSAFELCN